MSAARTMFRVWSMFIRSPVPYGPPVQPVFTSQTGHVVLLEAVHQQVGVDARVARQERRPEAGGERRARLLDPDLGAGELRRVAADEVVGRLLARQARDRRQHAERVGGQEDHVARRAGDAGRIGVADEVQRVGAAGVLGEPLGVEVELARHRVDVDVLEDRPEAPGRGEDVRLVHRREADRLGVAAALEVEDVVAAPAVLVVADEAPQRIGRERRLARAREPEEDDESPACPTLIEECIGRTPSSGIR